MKKDVYTMLGFVTTIRYKIGRKEWELTFDKQMSWTKSKKKAVYVMLAKNKTEILVVEWKPKKIQLPKGSEKQKLLVHDCSQWEVKNAFSLPAIKTRLKRAGRITRIEYTSDKFEVKDHKRGKFVLTRHDFKNVVPFFTNAKEDTFKFKYSRLLSGRGIIA